ncbi:hypothetical protein ACLK1V_00545 [Escherichia coli]
MVEGAQPGACQWGSGDGQSSSWNVDGLPLLLVTMWAKFAYQTLGYYQRKRR